MTERNSTPDVSTPSIIQQMTNNLWLLLLDLVLLDSVYYELVDKRQFYIFKQQDCRVTQYKKLTLQPFIT